MSDNPQDVQDQQQTPPEGGTSEPKTFSQERLDEIIKERLAQERKKYADYSELKAAADKLKEIEAAQLSEAEKTKLELQTYKQQAEQAQAQARNALIRSAVVAAAASANFADPNDAYKMLDMATLEIEGETIKGVSDAIAELAKAKPYLLKQQQTQTTTTTNTGQRNQFSATNPSGQAQPDDLSWHPLKRGAAQIFSGEVVKPDGG